nr:MAG TPA: hypothetical protein [Caudoviricetes sp.]
MRFCLARWGVRFASSAQNAGEKGCKCLVNRQSFF